MAIFRDKIGSLLNSCLQNACSGNEAVPNMTQLLSALMGQPKSDNGGETKMFLLECHLGIVPRHSEQTTRKYQFQEISLI